MTAVKLGRFAEKYQLARGAALQSNFERGTAGLEVEWNVSNAAFRPLHHVGAGPAARSFSEVLRRDFIPPALADRNELEVFHWMTEWITRPYYDLRGVLFEARILEGCMLNALNAAGFSFGERLYPWHGNVLWPLEVAYDSIPREWELTKRRYLERCVDLFGVALATAGVHVNVSLPEPLLSLDFLHQPGDGSGVSTLAAFRDAAYIRGARVLRAFSALFNAMGAASPLRAEWCDGRAVIVLTECDSNRLARFPNPANLDVPDLYRSHADYVRISTDLVRRRIRFGNNNWTPTRARSDRTAVDGIIHLTSDELQAVYLKGIYGVGEPDVVEQLAQRIEMQNMITRVELPMSRVEIRSGEGGHDFAIDLADVAVKQLLLIWSYADPEAGAAFRYDADDVKRARRNEALAAEHGLRATIEHPFTHRSVTLREFLRWTLDEVRPLAQALGWEEYLVPLETLAGGAMNTAERLRNRLRRQADSHGIVPVAALHELVEERQQQVAANIAEALEQIDTLGPETAKRRELLAHAAAAVADDPSAPIHFELRTRVSATVVGGDKTAEIIELAQRLIRIPSVTNCPRERLEEVQRAARFIAGCLRDAGVPLRFFDSGRYPAVLAHFPGRLTAPVMLSGHFDVVEPATDDGEFTPRIDGDFLVGRGAADMKTVVATYLVWMRDVLRRRPPVFPPINLLLVGNEENGETEPMGTPHVLAVLANGQQYTPGLLIAGERTGEGGTELFGEICIENRGVVRVTFVARGEQAHTGTGGTVVDLGGRIVEARDAVLSILRGRLTRRADEDWKTDYRFPFIAVGTPGVYNITADSAQLGLEIRPVPQDDIEALLADLRGCAEEKGLEMIVQTREPGVACRRDNPYLLPLIDAVRDVSGAEPVIGRKKPGTSGRFAPQGQAVIWGQTGIGPHAPRERHFIPSIRGYYDALERYARLLVERGL